MAAPQLPTELLAAILEPLSPAELAAAATVCWRFNAVAERLLYANVHIVDLLCEGPLDGDGAREDAHAGEDEEDEEDEGEEEEAGMYADEEEEESGEESEGRAMSEGEDGDGDGGPRVDMDAEQQGFSEDEEEGEGYSDEDDVDDALGRLSGTESSTTPWRTLRWATALRRRPYLWDSVRRVHIRWQAKEDGCSPTHSPAHSYSHIQGMGRQSESETRQRREREAEAQRQFGLHQSYPQQQQSQSQQDVYAQQRHRDEAEWRRQEEQLMQHREQQRRRRKHAAEKQRSPPSENPLVGACDRLGSVLRMLTALESLELFLGPANFVRVRLPASVVSSVPAHVFPTHRVLATHSYRQPLAFQHQQRSFVLQTQVQQHQQSAAQAETEAAEAVPLMHAIERVVQACTFPNLRALSLGVDSQPKTASSSPTQSSVSLSQHSSSSSSLSSYALNVPYNPYSLNAAPYSPYTSYASSAASTSTGASPYAYAPVYPYAPSAYASHPLEQQRQPVYTLRQPAYTAVLPAFLARLPHLTHLRIAASSSSSSSAYSDADGGDSGLAAALAHLPPDALPALQSFRGSARAAARLVPGRTIMQLALAGRDEEVMGSSGAGAGALMMGAYNGGTGGALPLLAQGAVPLRVLDLSAMSARPMLLRSVAQVLSTLECLRVKLALRHTLHYSFSGIRMLAPLANVLSLLPNLTFLDLAPTGVDGFGRADPQSAGGHDTEERALCAEWARACPSLRRVIFPSQSEWVRGGDDMMTDADCWTLAVAAES